MSQQPLTSAVEALWQRFAPTGAFVIAVIGGFMVPPPIGSEQEPVFGLARFLTTLLAGLMFIATRKWSAPQHLWSWVAATILLIAAGVAGFFWYRYLAQSWTCDYFGLPTLVGTDLTEFGAAYLAEHGAVPCDTMLEDFLGNAERIWEQGTIVRRRLQLAGVYLGGVLLSAASLMALAQAVRLAPKAKRS